MRALYRDPVHDFGLFRYDPSLLQFLEVIPTGLFFRPPAQHARALSAACAAAHRCAGCTGIIDAAVAVPGPGARRRQRRRRPAPCAGDGGAAGPGWRGGGVRHPRRWQ